MPETTQQEDTPAFDNWFRPDFDREMGESLVRSVQETIGCFECGDPDPTKTCSRCKLAKYCSQDCQKTDWKKSHKELCSIYLENKQGDEHNPGAPVPILLRSVGLLGEEAFESAVINRKKLFLRAASTSHKKPLPMSFSCAIVPLFEKLRLVIAPSFLDDVDRIHQVPHLVAQAVDESKETADAWDDSKEIGGKAFAKVVETLAEFHEQIIKAGIQPLAVTCGSGLNEQVDELEEALNRKGVSGLGFVAASQLYMD